LLYEADFHSVETNGLPAGKKQKKKKVAFFFFSPTCFPLGRQLCLFAAVTRGPCTKTKRRRQIFLDFNFYFISFFFSGSSAHIEVIGEHSMTASSA
jgi:hypothetical protein